MPSSGSQARAVARLLMAIEAPLWIISATGHLTFLSDSASAWLGVEPETLVNRLCRGGSPASDHPADRLAASLSPPPGLSRHGIAQMLVTPLGPHGTDIQPRSTRFLRLGSETQAPILAVVGDFADLPQSPDTSESIAMRQLLDGWRKRHAALAVTVTAGTSAAARRLRSRVQLAAQVRSHIGFFGPLGCHAESIAVRVHQQSAGGELLCVVDGPLMDAELLEATIAPAVDELGENETSRASVLVRGLDEMPIEAQSRLADVVTSAAGRLRLLGLCGQSPQLYREPVAGDALADLPREAPRVLEGRLAELLSVFFIPIEPLASRVQDLPLVAAALLDARHAAGEGPAERISRKALDAMVIYPWPGNMVELDEAIRHAIRTASSDSLLVEHLPLAVRTYRAGEAAKPIAKSISLDRAVQRYELRLIHEAVEAADGNRAEAARRLGISRARLLRRLDEAEGDDSDDTSGAS